MMKIRMIVLLINEHNEHEYENNIEDNDVNNDEVQS
jgi:hypothetical protein